MIEKQDPIAHAARILREAAEELRQAHNYPHSEGWENETDAKAAYDEHMAAAQALEDWEAAVGAGGVQALSAAPAGFVPVAAFDRLHAHAESLAARLLAASPTPPAEQQAMESVLVDGAASQPPISNTLWRMLTGGYEHTYILQLPNDSRDRRELIDRACRNWRRICAEIGNSAVASAVSPQTAQAPQQAAPKAAPGERRNTKTHDLLSTVVGVLMGYREGAARQPYKPGSVIDKVVNEAVEHLKDWPYPEAAPQQEAQEPVAWQSRTRPTWGGDTKPWSPWELCTKGQAEDYWKTPLLHDWAYEARALYTAPQPAPAPLPQVVQFSQDQRRALKEARYTAMEWSAKGRIPESGAFGAIAQNLDWLQAETSAPQNSDARTEFELILQTKPESRFWNNYDAMLWAFVQGRAVQAPSPAPAPLSDDVVRDAAFEVVRKKLCALPRYSFVLDDDGLVRSVQDRTGNWIEFDDAHELFDPVAVDAALAARGGK